MPKNDTAMRHVASAIRWTDAAEASRKAAMETPSVEEARLYMDMCKWQSRKADLALAEALAISDPT